MFRKPLGSAANAIDFDQSGWYNPLAAVRVGSVYVCGCFSLLGTETRDELHGKWGPS